MAIKNVAKFGHLGYPEQLNFIKITAIKKLFEFGVNNFASSNVFGRVVLY
jgi:hypothetical protein